MSSEDEALSTVNIYPEASFVEDLTPDFGIEIDEMCDGIYEACKGWGNDKKALIDLLGSTMPETRAKISKRYPQLHDKGLMELLKSELSGHFGQAMRFLSYSPHEAECAMIHRACEGMGSKEKVLYPIVCGRSNADMALLKKTYYNMYTKDLGQKLSSNVSGDLKKLVLTCAQGAEQEYDKDYHTEEFAKEEAEAIYKAGQGKWFGTDEKKIFKIVALANPKFLKMVNTAYADLYGYTLEKAMEKELSGNARAAAIFTLGMKLKPYETVAALIKSACAGFGTNELLLTCCLIRYQDIMGQVQFAHISAFEKTIHDRVRHEVSGNYKNILLAVLNKIVPEDEGI